MEHLIALSARPAVRLPQLDTVQIDSTHGPEFLSGEAQLAKYRTHLDRMERIALSPQASRDFIRDVVNGL